MCGFPLAHLDKYLKIIVHQNHRFVAMCEEFKRLDGTFERRVVRIVTPGTLIDESFLNHYENNYLASISSDADTTQVGLAWTDISTGELFSQPTTIENLRDDLARISPKEVVLPASVRNNPTHPFLLAVGEDNSISISYAEASGSTPTLTLDTENTPNDPQEIHAPPTYTPEEMSALRLLNKFLRDHLLEFMPQLPAPVRQNADLRMQIDIHTINGLEIKERMREGGSSGSLLSTIRRTVTSGGTRLLARWLCTC
jgi:DNA mismatch repair ATPase MutS